MNKIWKMKGHSFQRCLSSLCIHFLFCLTKRLVRANWSTRWHFILNGRFWIDRKKRSCSGWKAGISISIKPFRKQLTATAPSVEVAREPEALGSSFLVLCLRESITPITMLFFRCFLNLNLKLSFIQTPVSSTINWEFLFRYPRMVSNSRL